MDQVETKVRFPLRYKLLISIILLLVGVIGFLGVSSLIILKEDKKTYTYLIQGSEAELAGKEFLYQGSAALNLLRQALANRTNDALLGNMIQNQNLLLGLNIVEIDPSTSRSTLVLSKFKDNELKQSKFEIKDFTLDQEWMYILLPEINKHSFTWMNFSKPSHEPTVGLILADLKNLNENGTINAAIGVFSITKFAQSNKGSRVTVATNEGWSLYDSDPTYQFDNKNLKEDLLFQFALKSTQNVGAKEIEIGNEPYLGSYFKTDLNLIIISRNKLRHAMGPFYSLLEKFFVIGVMVVAIAIIFAVIFAKRLTSSITRLTQATRQISEGNFNVDAKVKSKDEIGLLSKSFSAMSQKINTLIKEQMEKVRMQGELAIASTVQKTLIPPSQFLSDKLHIKSFYQSASECGGDWWGYLNHKNKFSVLIADATGHGIPSALVTASARSCFSVMQKLIDENPSFPMSPSILLSFANRVVYEASGGNIMMTFFAGVIDLDKKTLTYSSAGHNPPWLFSNDGSRYQMKSLTAKGVRLGEGKLNTPYEEKTVKINSGDLLFLYTDGILEGTNKNGEQYGKKQMRRVLNANIQEGPDQLIAALVKDFSLHNENKPLDDDVTLTAALIL